MAVLPYSTSKYPAPRNDDAPPERPRRHHHHPVHVPDPIPPLKDELARAVVDRLEGWSQDNAADLLDTDQPRMSDLRNGRLARFSLERLIRFALRLGADVHITVTWTARRRWIANKR
jgi:predicted XRE-type DNA-binding protein